MAPAIVIAAAALLAGCSGRSGGAQPADAPEAVRPSPPPVAEGARAPAQASCTAQWRAHGHTGQDDAQAFAAKCLRAQGAVDRQLDAATVMNMERTLLPASAELARLDPRDIETFCPGYRAQGAEGRATFWRGLFTAIARPESGYRTAKTYWEGGGLQQFSIGLLQLSLTDEAGYRCGFSTEADIADAERNLACGIRIMTTLVGRAGVIGGDPANVTKGGAAYWSTLRSSSRERAPIIRETKALPVCQQR